MEVTRKNFKEALPLVKKSIEAADFMAIDTEFTGLMSGRDVNAFDTPAEYYRRLRDGASDFLLIQFGLVAFYWDNTAGKYMNDAYNFYVYPRMRPGPDRVFLCQSSSLEFLAGQGFDFNKLLAEGIPYLTEPAESMLRVKLQERQKTYSNGSQQRDNPIITIPEENKQQIENILEQVKEFLALPAPEAFEVDRCNAFVRRLVFQEVGLRFKDQVFVESKMQDNGNRVLKISRLTSSEDSRSHEEEKKKSEWDELEEAVGFSRVARMITESEKLVVGHNMVLDVLHTLNHFYQPLPEDYSSFKEFAHCMFPRLLDTKYMSSLPPFKDKVGSSVLQHLLATLSEHPFSVPQAGSLEGRGYRRAEDKSHEAGYDAYVTGLCFLAMHAHLARMRGDGAAAAPAQTPRVSGDAPHLKPFLNKLYLSRTAHHDSPYMNLAGAEPTPNRENVFHISFPLEWTRTDISQLFSPFGPVFVNFIDDVSALVSLSRREQARAAARGLAQRAPRHVTITPYHQHYARIATGTGGSPAHWLNKERLDAYRKQAQVIATTKAATPKLAGTVADDGVSSTTNSNFIPLRVERKRTSSASSADTPAARAARAAAAAAEPAGARKGCSNGGAASAEVAAAEARGARRRTCSSSGVFDVLDAAPPEPPAPRQERSVAVAAAGTPVDRLAASEVSKVDAPVARPRKAELRAKKRAAATEAAAGAEVAAPTAPAGPAGPAAPAHKIRKVSDMFDRLDDPETKCVAAFEESDNWD